MSKRKVDLKTFGKKKVKTEQVEAIVAIKKPRGASAPSKAAVAKMVKTLKCADAGWIKGAGNETFPACLRIKFRYEDYYRATASTGALPSTTILRLNSLYDPAYQTWSNNGQPYYFDQMVNSSMYNEYVVYGCKVKLRMRNNNNYVTDVLIRWQAVDSTTPSSVDPTTAAQLVTMAAAKDSCLINMGQYTGAGSIKTFKRYFDIAKMYGLSPNDLMSEQGYEGSVAGNPAAQAFMHVTCGPSVASGEATTDVGLYLHVTYYAEIKTLSSSVAPS